ncbi:MAG: Hpt domain-containing protein [Chitinophagaceae bacterium]|nr:Hpt domain-containing protein [Oligoflexus sp.]
MASPAVIGPVLDDEILENLLALDGNKGLFLDELIDIYTNASPAALLALINCLETGTPKEISRLAHKVRGMVGNLGAIRLAAVLEFIEVSSETLEPGDFASLPDSLRYEQQLFLAALRDHRHSATKKKLL